MRRQAPPQPDPIQDATPLAAPALARDGTSRRFGRWVGWRWLAPLAPVAVAALMLVLTGYLMAATLGYTRLSDFARIGARFGRHVGVQQLAVSDLGYDGQFFYYLAVQPRIVVTCAQTLATCPLDVPPERAQRILYPMVVRLVALGQPALVPPALLLVDLIAALVTVALVGQLAVAAGASRWLGVAAGLFAGEVFGVLGDLSDPFAAMWLVLAVWLARARRPLASALAVAAALLTREQLLFVLPLLALPLVAQRRWRTLAVWLALALAPLAVWEVALRVLYGVWPFAASAGTAGLVLVPFGGLLANAGQAQFWSVVLLVALPVVGAAAIALARLAAQLRAGWLAVARDPVPLMALVYCCLCSLLSHFEWADPVSAGRLALPGVVLGVVAVSQLARPVRLVYAVPLVAFAVVAASVALTRLL